MFNFFDKFTNSDSLYVTKTKPYLHDCDIELRTVLNYQDPDKRTLLRMLYIGILEYLHTHEGFKDKSTQDMIIGMDNPKNSSVKRAAQFRNFLLTYPIENDRLDLINDVGYLYAGQREFPHGLGNSRYLRNAICEAFGPHYHFPDVYKKTILFSHQSSEHVRLEKPILESGKSMQAKFSGMALCMMTLKNLQILPRELTSYILEFVIATDNNTHAGLKSLPTSIRPQPVKAIELETFDDDNKDLGEFVIMSGCK